MANIDSDKEQTVEIDLTGVKIAKVSGTILTAKSIDSYNTFENPNAVAPANFKDAKVTKTGLTVKLPAKSIVALELL